MITLEDIAKSVNIRLRPLSMSDPRLQKKRQEAALVESRIACCDGSFAAICIADGTVIYGTKDRATEEKLSYVRDWRDIVSIAAGSYGKLIGLHANGRVVGLHDWENDWRNIVGIAGGDFFYGVDRQGALYTTNRSIRPTNRTLPLFRDFDRLEDEIRESRTSSLAFLHAAETYKSQGLCPYCGGEFTGRITQKCTGCNRRKDY